MRITFYRCRRCQARIGIRNFAFSLGRPILFCKCGTATVVSSMQTEWDLMSQYQQSRNRVVALIQAVLTGFGLVVLAWIALDSLGIATWNMGFPYVALIPLPLGMWWTLREFNKEISASKQRMTDRTHLATLIALGVSSASEFAAARNIDPFEGKPERRDELARRIDKLGQQPQQR